VNRREFLRNSGGLAALSPAALSPAAFSSAEFSSAEFSPALAAPALPSSAFAFVTPDTLPPWQPGNLDLHHINTGRGNATLAILPDGTSLLIDAGASSTQGPAMCAARPELSAGVSQRPGQTIARYVQRQLKATSRRGLDYALLTHLHGDHIGDVTPESPTSSHGEYKVTGISDVAETISIGKLIDRGFPNYSYPAPIADATGLNHIRFTKSIATRGTSVEQVKVGSGSQIVAQDPSAVFPAANVRIIAGNGLVWSGEGESSNKIFPESLLTKSLSDPAQVPSENSCSIALRIQYGKFSYFTGGDLTSDTNYGRDLWRDTETPAGKVAGPVSVSTCNHHGYFDATGPGFVSAVRPRVWILQSWHASHPAMSSLANMYSPLLYSGPRDVFSLGLHPAASLACGRFSDQFKSSQGHVVVRVASGGSQFSVFVLDDRDESCTLKATFHDDTI
jgi:beta-lactamase superfamily II metal-dependent hydrolase